ncbi:MAG: glycoside hydrolase family 2 protein [Spirochaetes bacterium]|nr:glycoside hydrolase family 2 protein [Spirochaetota bacterium]
MRKLSLAGIWNLRESGAPEKVPIELPGDIVSALLAAGLISDPYAGEDESAVQWVGRKDWFLEKEFSVDEEFLSAGRVFLDLEIVDTMADISLNGTSLGSSSDMFTRFRREVAEYLVPGLNRLSVLIHSPELAAQALAEALPYPIPASTYPISSPHRNLVRKAQCMGGWDWGPCLMTGGIYDWLELTAVDGPRIDYLKAEAKPVGEMDVKLGAERGPDFELKVSIEVHCMKAGPALVGIRFEEKEILRQVKLGVGSNLVSETFKVEKPRLWWPNGCGQRKLYRLEVSLGPVESPSAIGPHVVQTAIGFRSLLVRTKEDAIGREMVLMVNGHKIFAKGANWIPADALPSRWTQSRLRSLLTSAAEAGMNCLRVWGGGRYESDYFYAICDELGIMIWQDCMFSCALYPSSLDFLAKVEEEVRHQVKRLASHPSLALWCGNNEALGAITWYEESRKSPARYIVDYDRLTAGVLGRVIHELDPGRLFWPSSPSAGPDDFSDNWHSDERGDMHFWQVWHEGRPFSDYLSVQPRFCSEFGFQSFPSLRTIKNFAPASGLNVTSPAMEGHQRHPKGNSLIMDTMLRYFRMPKDFPSTLYLSQVQQALAIKTAVEYWRTNRPRCSGALYWQLNDVWPVTSWSSLEYDGSWKLLQYEAKRFYDSRLLAFCAVKEGLELRAANDADLPWKGEYRIGFRDFDGRLVSSLSGPAVVDAESSALFCSIPKAEFPGSARGLFVEAEFLSIGDYNNRRALAFLAEPKRCELANPAIDAKIGVATDGSLWLTIEAVQAPAFYVAPELPALEGRFEDSGFHLLKGEKRRLRFIPREEAAFEAGGAGLQVLSKDMVVRHLRSSYE